MKYIEFIEDFQVMAGQEYNVSCYPKSGVYRNMYGYVFVNKESTMAFSIGATLNFENQQELTAISNQSISESFVLKAIAIAQNPELAKELTK